MLKKQLTRYVDYWNSLQPTRTLFVFKIAWTAAFLFELTTSWWPDWDFLFSVNAPLKTDPTLYKASVWNLIAILPSDHHVQLCLGVLTVASLACLLNQGGRISLFIMWYLASCFVDLTPSILTSYHQFWRWLGVCLLLSPTPRWSINTTNYPVWTLRLIQLHVAMIYGYSAIAKALKPIWQDGGVVAFVFSSPGHLSQTGEKLALWSIFQNSFVINVLTWSVLLLEACLPFVLLTRRFRWLGLALAVAFHISLLIIMDIDRFQIYMLSFLTAFIPWTTLKRNDS